MTEFPPAIQPPYKLQDCVLTSLRVQIPIEGIWVLPDANVMLRYEPEQGTLKRWVVGETTESVQ